MTEIWAHRGANLLAPENTIPAVQKAIELGADGIEIDVQRSQDGVIVVCHDETLDRTSNGQGLLNQHTFKQLQQLDFSAGKEHEDKQWYQSQIKIPTLAQILELLAGSSIRLNIELKNSVEPYRGMESEVDQLVVSHKMVDQVVYSSFNHKSMKKLAALGSKSDRAILFARPIVKSWKRAKEFFSQGIHPSVKHFLLAETVKKCHKHGIAVRPWTVDKKTDLRLCFQAKVDAVITNDVEKAIRLRTKINQPGLPKTDFSSRQKT